MSHNKSTLICRCKERRLLDETVPTSFQEQGNVVMVDDLCRCAMRHDVVLGNKFSTIHACHPRAVRALFSGAGFPLNAGVKIVNHRKVPPAPNPLPGGKSSAWFPAIDYDRCTSCGQCHDFCLFGVYTRDDDGQVLVTNPGNCKNNCPACARICPATAIIFPKVGESPIDGAEVSDENERKANVQVNVDEILGDDIYAALNARKEKRRSLLNQKKVEKALEERRRCSAAKGSAE